ncbi:MAG: hypothetical protein ACREPB_08465 [Arenimonas sp.]
MNTKKVSTSAETSAKTQRLPYTSPSLKVYGQLRELTDGGSGALAEGAMMTALMRFA